MLVMTLEGLYCPLGNFYIDPKGKVQNAVITHAHSDHARKGAAHYYSTTSGVSLLKSRLGKNIVVKAFNYGEKFLINGIQLSFHPAGHILGSAQICIKHNGETWVVSGDYKRQPDPTCEAFEVIKCDVFITEATFGTPNYSWDNNIDNGKKIFEWWLENSRKGLNSLLLAYSLGKTQRILGLLKKYTSRSIYCHASAISLNECYRAEGIELLNTISLNEIPNNKELKGELIISPPSILKSKQIKILGPNLRIAFVSGWMSNSQRFGPLCEQGFVLSDHADWKDLLLTIQQTGAKRIFVQHRGNGTLVKHLKSLGIHAYPCEELFPIDSRQLCLF
ncbi:ligase-associated DNA damage response exonuclease [Nitrosomonas supralitoralis]|uniref:DNA ligase-associated DEXH box helicase n=1 Tax=Nitrosomonas supralitoralis TaxID=2116706 RepID=A0A2P7NRK1_9PROT|nr:ligase-associated DNA damage response exonuclease [Nitrosomonas supralitoralis]PSJ16111.1 DNA ligase-associated DEXH box helicase [Nitrosomonas supralitoralis]